MTRDRALAQAIREKTIALMSNPPKMPVTKPVGHRSWMVPLAERKGPPMTAVILPLRPRKPVQAQGDECGCEDCRAVVRNGK